MLMFVAPFHHWRRVSVRERRTKRDLAEELERLVMHDFADAEKVTLVWDNLNTHTKGALDKRFEPEYCRKILRRCEFCLYAGAWQLVAVLFVDKGIEHVRKTS